MEHTNFIIGLNKNIQAFRTNILIPAYDKNKNGIMFNLALEATFNDVLTVETHGNIATSLDKNLRRAITILSNLSSSWGILRKLKYTLTSMENQCRVMDSRSAGLPICIALLNIARTSNGLNQVQNLTGTGILRIDGSFEKSHLEEEKKQATSQLMESRFINANVCKHVFDLATLMNDY